MEVSRRMILLSDTRLTGSVATVLEALLHQSATLTVSQAVSIYVYHFFVQLPSLVRCIIFRSSLDGIRISSSSCL